MALQVWLPLTGDFHNQGLDNEMTSITGTGCSFSNDGKIGSCLKLGYTNNLTVPSLAGAKQLSIAYWCRVDTATSTNWLDPIRFYSTDGSTTQYSRQEFYNNCTQIGFWYAGGSLGGWNGVEVGVWNHYAITFNYETGVVEFYINGEKKYTQTNLNTTHYVSGINIRLGDSGLAISENDMRIYDHVLSAKEISELAKGLVLHYPLSMPGGENLAKNTSTITNPSSNGRQYQLSSIIPSGTTVTISCRIDADNITLSGNKRLGLSTAIDKTDGTGKYWFETWKGYGNGLSDGSSFHGHISNTAVIPGDMKSIGAHLQTVSSGTATISEVKVEIGDKRTPWIPNPADAEYSALGFDDGIEYDVSGFGNNGTKVGDIIYLSESPRYSTCAYIKNTSNITHPRCLNNTDQEWTCCAWVKLDASTQHQPMNNFNYSNNIVHVTTPLLYLNEGANDYYMYGKEVVPAGIWTHIAFVFKNSTGLRNIYINGVLKNDFGPNKTSTPLGIPNTVILFNNPFSGYVSDYREYATALSADDILELYHTSASLANNGTLMAYEFNEG